MEKDSEDILQPFAFQKKEHVITYISFTDPKTQLIHSIQTATQIRAREMRALINHVEHVASASARTDQ